MADPAPDNTNKEVVVKGPIDADTDSLVKLVSQQLTAGSKSHKFWDTQPVPKIEEKISGEENTFIHPPIAHEELRKEPYPLLPQFEWAETNVDDDAILEEVYNLLNANYVEDDDNMFRFDYSKEFLRWALKPPGYLKSWHIGVRLKANKKLVAFITGIPADIRVYDKTVHLAEINFLCVHKKLRSKRLAPVLIKEITRRVHLQGIFQAVYTAGIVLPSPISRCRYYHRSLNPKKLIEVGFSQLGTRMTMSRTIKLYKLANEPVTPGIRPMEAKDAARCCVILSEYLSRFNLAATFNEKEFIHWFLPREGIIDTFVVEDPATHEVTDFVSFYTLPSTIIGNKTYNTLKAAYCYYYTATKTDLTQLMNDALILARSKGFDVFNALEIFDNKTFLKELKFGIGDGHLQYYLYNWKCSPMAPASVGLVLL